MHEITVILDRVGKGDPTAADALLPLVYDELRRLAHARMSRESASHTLQPTALVHEAWVRLGADSQPTWQNRGHFFAAAAEAMRRILIDAARKRRAERHGGGLERLNVDGPGIEVAAEGQKDDELLGVSEAVDKLATVDSRKAELVKLRYFAGLTIDEAADALGISAPTAKRDWAYARAWLYREIGKERGN